MKLNYGLIGLGRMGAEPSTRIEHYMKNINDWLPVSHAEVTLKMSDRLNFLALCDKNKERLEHFSQVYEVQHTYEDYKKMLDNHFFDFISIATRSDARADIMKYAIQKGIAGIYAEKPFVQSLKDCKELLTIAKEKNIKLALGTTRRGMAIYRKAKELIESGQFGRLEHISIEYGVNTLMWNHPHSADMIVYYAGNNTAIRSIQANGYYNNIQNDKFIDDDLNIKSAYIEFQNGVSASFVAGKGYNIRLFLSEAIITIIGDGYCLDIEKKGENPYYFHERERIFLEKSISGAEYIFNALVSSLTDKTKFNIFTYDEILKGNEIIFGIAESIMRKGSIISPQEIDEDRVITGKFNGLSA